MYSCCMVGDHSFTSRTSRISIVITQFFRVLLYSGISSMVVQGSSGAGEGFEVTKFGHGRVALIGFPRLTM